MNAQNEFTAPSSRRAAWLGALPFLAYGMVSLLGKLTLDNIHPGTYIWIGFYVFILIGLLIGWVRSFPRWSYAYLGWALLLAWLWGNAYPGGTLALGSTFSGDGLGGWRFWLSRLALLLLAWARAWLPLVLVALLALVRTRSLRPVKQFFIGIWNDWTRLSFILFVFPAWLLLLYDENHHPYLLLFMLASTLVFGLSVYFYLRAAGPLPRILSLLGGTLAGLALSWICENTWDYQLYYNLPPSHDPWYMLVFRWSIVLVVIALFLLAPALLALLRTGIRRLQA